MSPTTVRILAINQFYRPDLSASAALLSDLAEGLVGHGHAVSVIASRGSYLGGEVLPRRETLSGVDVVRPWATSYGKRSIATRLSDYLSFWAGAIAQAAIETRPDVIVAMTSPPMIAAGAAAVCWARGIPLITWAQDLYPDIAVVSGMTSHDHPGVTALRALNKATHRRSVRTVVLSQGMAERIVAQGQRRDRITIVPNWADGDSVRPVPHVDNRFRRQQGLDDRFVVMYSGNLGVGHDVETFIDAAKRLRTIRPQVMFLFVGGGKRRDEAADLASGLDNVRFLPYQPRDMLAQSLSAGDVHLASLRQGFEGLVVPCKLYGVMAAGRPLFYVGPAASELARVVDEDDLGWTGRPGDVDGLTAAIVHAVDEPAETSARGERARQVFDERYGIELSIQRWCRLLDEVIGTDL